MIPYRIEELLAECCQRQDEIELIYKKEYLIEQPPSENFYVDKYYNNDPYPIWGSVKGC